MIDKLALDIVVGCGEDEIAQLDMNKLYDFYASSDRADDRADDFDAIENIAQFVCTCLRHKAWSQLQNAWRTVDLTQLKIVHMLSLLTGTHLIRPSSLLPEQPLFIARCKAELLRRGETQIRADRLFDGLQQK